MDERKAVLSYVANNLKGKMTLIAHVGAPSTRDSIELAKHAASLGYDALSAIPPIYFKLPDSAVSKFIVHTYTGCEILRTSEHT
ncbi:N-acetylneuraminate lyase [compost metagenome]